MSAFASTAFSTSAFSEDAFSFGASVATTSRSPGGRFIGYLPPARKKLVETWTEDKQQKLRDALLRQAEEEELKRIALEQTSARQRRTLAKMLEVAQKAYQLEQFIVLLLDQAQKHRQSQERELSLYVEALSELDLL